MVASHQAWSYLADDPLRSPPGIRDVAGLLAWLELGADPAAAILAAGDGAVLVHALAAPAIRPALHWTWLDPPLPIGAGGASASLALVLATSLEDLATALRMAARIRATFAVPGALADARSCTTRAALLRALAPIEERAGESSLTGDEVLAILRTRETGLTPAEAAVRLDNLGPNRLERVRRRPLALRLLDQLMSLFALLLWGAGVLAMVAGMPQLGWTIFAVVLLNGAFGFFQEYRAERALEAIERLLPHELPAVRGGADVRVPVERLVPGDVVRLAEGDQVPADGQVIASDLLRLEQSSLTGEPHPVFKTPAGAPRVTHAPPEERPEHVFAGTGIVSGSGVMVVFATGMATRIGGIARLTQSVGDKPSPLVREVARVTRVVTLVAIALGAGSFALSLALQRLEPREGFLFGLGMIVANVPEGLLPVLTLALALGAQRMARRRSIVKRLSSVETLGAVSVICTDKTGTLTENRMALRHVWSDGRSREFDEAGGDPGVCALLECAALASVATADRGDPTECALVIAAQSTGLDVEAVRAAQPVVTPLPFDSFRRRMTLVRRAPEGLRACVKGAPRGLLERCDTVRVHGAAIPLCDEDRAAFLEAHDRAAAEGHRMLAVAERRLDACPVHPDPREIEAGLTLLGFVALWDPPRADVREAVALCRRAGIRVVMVTGDDGLTARAIAARIALPTRRIVLGEEVARLSAGTLRDLAMTPGVLFARMSPEHKLAVVGAIRTSGAVVAVTGDGVNDAPALKAADIGVAMGRRGSEVAKEAAEMVITDDHFASIVAAVREGRSIYSNIGRFMRYVLASNTPEFVPFLAFVFLRIPLPLTVMQILLVDLGTDVLPALALGAESPEPGVMDAPPRRRSERLLSARRLALAYGFLGLAEAALCMLGFFWIYWLAGWRPGLPMDAGGGLYARATTMTFAGIVAAQVGNVFACRTEHESVFRVGLLGNRLVLWGIAVEIALLLALVLTPPLASFFGFAPLSPREWLPLLAYPPLILGLDEARKLAVRRWTRRMGFRRSAARGTAGVKRGGGT
jgi:calcium-translocating P-type ATPase